MKAIESGATRVIAARPMSVQRRLELIEKYKANALTPMAGRLVSSLKDERIHKMDFSFVKHICTYGGKFPVKLIANVKRHFPNAHIQELYGMTETGGISLASLDDPSTNGGHRLFPNLIVKIVNDDGVCCGPNELGEIHVKPPYEFRGYISDPVETANAVDDEGFIRTGDIGKFDDNGFLFIVDRLKNIFFVFYFENFILPLEMEEFLAKLPGVREACIVGIPITPGYFLPSAVVVRMPDTKLIHSDVFNAIAGNFHMKISSYCNSHLHISISNSKFFCRQFSRASQITWRSLFC